MCTTLTQPDVPVDNNKKIWKMKISQKTKFLRGIFAEVLFLLKTTLQDAIGMEVNSVSFVIKTKKSNTYSSSANLLVVYGPSYRSVLLYTNPKSLPIFLAIGRTWWIIGLTNLLGWQRLPLYGRFGYEEMTRFLMVKIALLCRLSIGLMLLSVRGLGCNVWGIETCLCRSMHD